METVSRYAYQVYKSGSFTKAAEELYISQPSLSAAISRLEKDLGFKIFDRSTLPCSLTAEGRIYIDSLEEILECESNMHQKIKELRNTRHYKIAVGGSSHASYEVLSRISGEFYKKYPEISVTLDIGNTGTPHILWERLDSKELDVLVTYTEHRPKCIIEPLFKERLVVAMNKNMPGAEKLRHLALTREEILHKAYSPEREIEDMSIFGEVEFLDFSLTSETRPYMLKLLGSYKVSRYKIQNSRHSGMHYDLMCAGIGAMLATTLNIAQKPYNEDILFFMPKSEDSYRQIYLAYNSASGNIPLIKDFLRVAKSIYKEK